MTGYYGLLRIGEMTASPHVIKACDVHLGKNKRKLMFVLHSSKTHTIAMKPQIIKISHQFATSNHKQKKTKSSTCCPYAIIRNYLDLRPGFVVRMEQFFIFSDGSGLKAPQFRSIFKTLLIKANLNHKLYEVHGLRSGRASDLLKFGVSVETIKKLGRWKSNAVFTYLR